MRGLTICFFLCVAAIGLADDSAVAIHYRQACLLRDSGDFSAAIEEVAKGIALNPQGKEWLAKSEVLSSELYLKLGMLKQAAVTARQVEILYKGTEFEAQARSLSAKIKRLTDASGESE